jgi:IPT/TIG domain
VRSSWRITSIAAVCGTLLVAVPIIATAASKGHGRPPAPPAAPPLAAPVKTVHASVKNDVSKPLRSIAPVAPGHGAKEAPENRQIPRLGPQAPSGQAPDPVVQTQAPALGMPSATSFDGLSNADNSLDVIPPDTNGDVGTSDYVEFVNLAFAIYSKSGTRLYGPADGSTLWSGFGGVCEADNDGDPVVQYDPLADRWLFSQFALPNYPSGPFYQCLAVSTTSDPTGSYYRYAFKFSDTTMNDYPKFGVWPDGYYMSVVEFDASGNYAGPGAVVFDRAKMLAGQAATAVKFDLGSSANPILPSDLDGSTPPPDGSPNYFGELVDTSGADALKIRAFHVDWTTPASSTFTLRDSLVPASFSTNIGFVDEPLGYTDWLDALADRPMYRFAYRNLGSHEALVMDHTVNVSGHAGVRWYELRKTSGSWSIFQQGTFSPSSDSRWMGSAAMDGSGDIAVGYSASSTSLYPSIRYAGRLATDPLGSLSQGEATMVAGTGAETDFSGRWGDYSSMNVDPSDDCTFWYANEYFPSTSDRDWHTRIGHFKFPACGVPPPTIDGFDPTSGEAGTSVAITGSNFDGATAVRFNGTSASFTVDDSTDIAATVPAGASDGTISVTTLGGTATSASSFDVIVPPPTIDSFLPSSGLVGTNVTITGTNLTGASAVTFHGTSASTFTVNSPTQVTAKVPLGATTGPIAVTTAGGVATSASDFTVTVPPPTVSGFSPASGAVGAVVTVNGTNMASATAVSFGGVATAPMVVSATQVKAPVPAAAATGKIGVTNPGGTALSAGIFKVLPKLTSFLPAGGAAGASVTIAGSGFTGVSAVKLNGVAAGFTADSDHQITATVPATATTGKVSVVTAGGTATSLTNFTVVPTITGFSPGSAAAGSTVLVDGTGFGSVTSVKVNGVAASFTRLSALQVRLTVPAAASSGTISVTTGGGTATSAATLFVLPKVTGFTPSSAAVGATVTINGNAFGGASSVLFNGVVAVPATVTPTKVTVVVPADASTGKLTVVTGPGSGQSIGTFKVLPKLTSFTPGSGAAGDSVTIAGSGFTDVSAVKLNGVAAGFTADSDHQITATVPATATTGKVSVVTAGGTATSLSNFLAVPTITGFTPGSAAPGSPVTVDGSGFGGVSSVKVNGVAAGFLLLSKLQLRLTVPASATSGTITVTTAGGGATSASTLSVLPRVTSFTPSAAAVGATVTINGNAFGGATDVLFNGVATLPATVLPAKITVPVPADASTGKLTVVTAAGAGQSLGTFKVLPKLTSFTPSSGVVGTSVTISGTGFTDVTAVKFNGHAASTYTRDSSTQITAMVPLGATTGKISVVTAGGTAISATSFVVVP